MSNVLVIHPQDRSTDFLKRIYFDKGYDVITDGNISEAELIKAIESHDKIIMMGHGTPSGLLNPQCRGWYLGSSEYSRPYVVDGTVAKHFVNKETISIWCFSESFFRPRGLKGMHTGMIISECAEQQWALGNVYLNAEEQLENMNRLADAFHDCIDKSPEEMKKYVLEHYTGDDPVTQFNRENIIVL